MSFPAGQFRQFLLVSGIQPKPHVQNPRKEASESAILASRTLAMTLDTVMTILRMDMLMMAMATDLMMLMAVLAIVLLLVFVFVLLLRMVR